MNCSISCETALFGREKSRIVVVKCKIAVEIPNFMWPSVCGWPHGMGFHGQATVRMWNFRCSGVKTSPQDPTEQLRRFFIARNHVFHLTNQWMSFIWAIAFCHVHTRDVTHIQDDSKSEFSNTCWCSLVLPQMCILIVDYLPIVFSN